MPRRFTLERREPFSVTTRNVFSARCCAAATTRSTGGVVVPCVLLQLVPCKGSAILCQEQYKNHLSQFLIRLKSPKRVAETHARRLKRTWNPFYKTKRCLDKVVKVPKETAHQRRLKDL